MNRTVLFFSFMTGLLLLCGCVHLQSKCGSLDSPPLPDAMRKQFARPTPKSVAAYETERAAKRAYRVKGVELAVAPGSTNADFRIALDYYQASRERSPVILLLPMAGGDYEIERVFAKYFARRGFSVVIERRRKIAHEDNKLQAISPWVEETVRDTRYVLDWMETRPELDPDRIALLGISTGGIRGVLLTALDHRIKVAVLGLAGGDLPYILTHTSERKIARRRRTLLREQNLTLPQLQTELRKTIPYDPNDLAAYVDCRKVLLVLGICDTVIPFKTGWELRAKIGKPATLLLPTGHYTAALAIPYIERQSVRFFEQRLGIKASDPAFQRLRSPRDASQ